MKALIRPVYLRLPERVRLGGEYLRTRDLIRESSRWSPEKALAGQLEAVREMAREAVLNSPFYLRRFREAGIGPAGIGSWEDFRRLPLLTRQEVQEHREEIISTTVPRRRLGYTTTGGSSGIPLGIYLLKDLAVPRETAFVHEVWSRFGFKPDRRHVILRGNVVRKGWMERWGPHLVLSTYHLTEGNVDDYVRAIRDFAPAYIQAYPSAISRVCQRMKERSLPPFESVEMVMCSSENLLPFQRELMASTLRVPVCNLYGNTERSFIAGNCPHSESLHFFPIYGAVELLDEKGNECAEGEAGEVVATGFTNPAYPLFRYRTGDFAVQGPSGCACGWNGRIVREVQGRGQEFLVTKDGRKVCIAAINMHSDIFDHVSQFQFHQSTPGRAAFRFVPREEFTPDEGARILAALRQKLGDDLVLEMRKETFIPLTSRGKHRFLVQELAEGEVPASEHPGGGPRS